MRGGVRAVAGAAVLSQDGLVESAAQDVALIHRSQLGELRHGEVCNVLALQLQVVTVAGGVVAHHVPPRLGLGVRGRRPGKVTVAGGNVVVVPAASLVHNI